MAGVLAATITNGAFVWNSKKGAAEITNPPQISAYDVIKQMSLEEKIGQMLMLDFRYWNKQDETEPSNFTVMNDEVGSIIHNYHLGGVILFKNNVQGIEQTTRLVDGLQKANSKIPLIVTTDQEGGIITRLQAGTNLPGNMAVGTIRDSGEAYNTGKIIGTELKSLGINHATSPVVDVNNNSKNPVIGIHSFGDKSKLVSQMGEATVRGL